MKGSGSRGKAFGTVMFLIAGACLCVLFLVVYPGGDLCRLFQYTLVLLCFLHTFLHRSQSFEGLLCLLAMLFTVLADFFLVALREAQWLLGLGVFCLAQLCWAVRLLLMERGKRRLVHLMIWAGVCGTLLIVAVILARGGDTLLLMGAVYASLLLTTVLFAWAGARNFLFTLGMTLFLGCDFFVMVNNAALYLDLAQHPLLSALHAIPFNMMWAFYGPSQMLLALSSARCTKPVR